MRSLYLVVREGENADEGDDVLVLDDREILRAVGSLIARRLGVGSIPRPLRSIADRPVNAPDVGEQWRQRRGGGLGPAHAGEKAMQKGAAIDPRHQRTPATD